MKAHHAISLVLIIAGLHLLKAQDSIRNADSSLHFLHWNTISGLPDDSLAFPAISPTPHINSPANIHHDLAGNIGNPGTAITLLSPAAPSQQGISLMQDPFSPYYQDIIKPGKFLLHIPYTKIHFHTGPGKEQNLQVLHVQQFTRRWYADVNFKVNSAPGKYQSQRTDLGTVSTSLAYTSLNKRYDAQLQFGHYKYRLSENGGISNDTIFLSGDETDPGVIPVHLTDASSVKRNSEWRLRHSLRLFPVIDSLRIRWLPNQLIHTIVRYDEYRTYTDPNPSETWYPAILKDNTSTLDSIALGGWRNTFSLTNAGAGNSTIYALGATMEDADYYDGGSSQQYFLLQPFFSLDFRPKKGHRTSLLLQQALTEKFKGSSWHIDHTSTTLDSLLQWKASIHFDETDVPLLVRHYRGNHFAWAGQYEPVQYFSAGGTIQRKGLVAKLQWTRTANSILYNAEGYPFQYPDPLQHGSFSLAHSGSLGPLWHHSRILYHLLEEKTYQPWPSWIISSTLMALIRPFGREFSLNAGTELTWMSKWSGYTYQPVTAIFHLQDEGRQGGRVLAEPFISLFMQRATISIKYRNLTNLLFGEGYFLVQGNPMSVPGLTFSVQWSFFD